MASPSSQKAADRPISFLLADQNTGQLISQSLIIRPEELTRTDPSRQSVTQTLGGAWLDDFGPGVATIQISGHTGWRGGINIDGAAAFLALKDTVFDQWHKRRGAAVAAGKAADVVQLIFADALDSFVNVVAPGPFVLKRSRSRPLLSMYQIGMTVLADHLNAALAAFVASGGNQQAGADSLTASLNKIVAFAASIRNFIQTNFIAPLQSVLGVINTAISKVLQVVGTVQGIITAQVQQVIGVAQDLAQVGRNMMYAYQAVTSLPAQIGFEISQVAAAFQNAFCVLSNVFTGGKQYPDYTGLYGSSSCSSTSGGSPLSPLASQNAFELIAPPGASPVLISAQAAASMTAMKNSDPVLQPMSQSTLALHAGNIGSGVVFA